MNSIKISREFLYETISKETLQGIPLKQRKSQFITVTKQSKVTENEIEDLIGRNNFQKRITNCFKEVSTFKISLERSDMRVIVGKLMKNGQSY